MARPDAEGEAFMSDQREDQERPCLHCLIVERSTISSQNIRLPRWVRQGRYRRGTKSSRRYRVMRLSRRSPSSRGLDRSRNEESHARPADLAAGTVNPGYCPPWMIL